MNYYNEVESYVKKNEIEKKYYALASNNRARNMTIQTYQGFVGSMSTFQLLLQWGNN